MEAEELNGRLWVRNESQADAKRLPSALIMGLLITGLVLHGGIDIIRDARGEQHT